MVKWLRNIVPQIHRLPQKGLVGFWEHTLAPAWRAAKNLGLLIVFLLLALAAGVGAYLLQRVAFPEAGSSAEPISATVYVEKLPAQVILQSTFTPSNATDNFSLSVKVTGPTREPDPWLLIVQCLTPPPGKPDPSSVPLYSESLAGTQDVEKVRVMPESTRSYLNFKFTCLTGLTQQGQAAATVVQDQDLNLSLPVLEQNPFAQSGLADAPLYAEKVAGKYKAVVELQALAGARCPTPAPSLSSASPSAGSSSPSAGTSSPSPTPTTPSSSPATTSPSAAVSSSPSPAATTPTTSSPAEAACYTPVLPGSTPVKYSFPAPTAGTTVATSEILNNVTLSDDRIDSIYPQGMIATNEVTWQGGVDLSPSLIATNLASAARQNKDAFWAGLLYGVAAALAIPYLVEFYKEWREERKSPDEKEVAGSGP